MSATSTKRYRSDDGLDSDELNQAFVENEKATRIVKNLVRAVNAAHEIVPSRIMAMIIKYKGDLNKALKAAVTAGDAQFLLQVGADASSHEGTDAVIQAAKRVHVEVIRTLLEHGAKASSDALLTAVTKRDMPCVSALVAHEAPRDPHMAYIAAGNGDVDIMRLILGKAVDADDSSVTAALYAAIKNDKPDVAEILLVEYRAFVATDMLLGAPAGILKHLVDYADVTLDMLIGVAMHGDAPAVNALLESGDLHDPDAFGPALHAAIAVRNADILKMLLDGDARVTIDVMRAANASKDNALIELVMLNGGAAFLSER